MDHGYVDQCYQTIKNMRPGKTFSVRLLVGITGFPTGDRPSMYDLEAMQAIARADKDELIFLNGVRGPSHRAGPSFSWKRYDDDDEENV